VPNVNLGYGILPGTMGSVSWQGDTNENGQAFGLWAATPNSVAGSGLLRVEVGGAFGTTPITLTPGRIYLPAILRDFTTQPIKNGDFSRPNLESWIRAQNPLTVSAAIEPVAGGSQAALLGDPAYPCDDVLPGYGSLSQSFIMPEPDTHGKPLVLEFTYHIVTDDQNPKMNLDQDRFDVLLNGVSVFSDTNRYNGYGCGHHTEIRNSGSVIVTGFSPGTSVNLTFRVQNGTSPDTDLNTYVCVDNVRLEVKSQ